MNTDIIIDLEYIDPDTGNVWDFNNHKGAKLWIEFWREVESRGHRSFKHKPNKKPRYLRTYHHYPYHREALYE